MLKQAIIFFFFTIMTFSGLAQENAQDSSLNKIYWDEWFKLEWSDFKGKHVEGDGIAAQSSIGLPYTLNSDGEGILKVSINVCFIKDESWSNSERINNVLLQHEQLHFDIAELHRRMIVKQLLEAKMNKNNYQEEVDMIIDKIWNEKYRAMQDKYDKETNFSRIIREQINWNRFIKQQLVNHKEFAFTELEINLIQFD